MEIAYNGIKLNISGEAHSLSSIGRWAGVLLIWGAAGMKAVLYAVRRGEGRWSAMISVDVETDWLYWGNESFRRGVVEGWGVGEQQRGLELIAPGAIVGLKEELPLGIAELAIQRLQRLWSHAEERRHRGNREQEIEDEIADAVKWAAARAGETLREQVIERWAARAKDREHATGAFEKGRALAARAREAAERLRGRQLLQAEASAALPGCDGGALLPVLQLASLLGGAQLAAGVAAAEERAAAWDWLRRRSRAAAVMRCRRCGSGEGALRRTPCASCGRQRCAYCEACVTMGRSRECGLLVVGAPADTCAYAAPSVPAAGLARRWGLSPAQSEAAELAMAFLQQQPPRSKQSRWPWALADLFRRAMRKEATPADSRVFLLWAVTGAGKTEMMFPLLEAVLSAGGRAAVATPRRDVVLELAPRLAAAFPNARQVVLYGGSADRFETGQLTLTTTHQLIRFRDAFDLVVIDEVDAFPYHNDPTLHYAASRARARSGSTVLLSATPPAALQRRARQGQLLHARVAVRHHRRPLPVPKRLAIPPLANWAAAGKDRFPAKLRSAIQTSLQRGAQLFLFVPTIRLVEPLVAKLRSLAMAFGTEAGAVDGTSSQDPDRTNKVTRFRERSIRLLVTTTILERGVTIPRSDVIVLGADKPLFDAASLVQMAGRAGRSADDPDGVVYFAAPAWTNAQRSAVRQIREMNVYAKRKGFFIPDSNRREV